VWGDVQHSDWSRHWSFGTCAGDRRSECRVICRRRRPTAAASLGVSDEAVVGTPRTSENVKVRWFGVDRTSTPQSNAGAGGGSGGSARTGA